MWIEMEDKVAFKDMREFISALTKYGEAQEIENVVGR